MEAGVEEWADDVTCGYLLTQCTGRRFALSTIPDVREEGSGAHVGLLGLRLEKESGQVCSGAFSILRLPSLSLILLRTPLGSHVAETLPLTL